MTIAVFHKLLVIFGTIAIGWIAIRGRWFGRDNDGAALSRALGDAAMTIFVPALLFRTMARLDLAAMPWRVAQAYFIPTVLLALLIYGWLHHRVRHAARSGAPAAPIPTPPAAPAIRTLAATYGNGVQLGIPFAAALFGEAGLAIHLALVSLHGVILLTLITVLAELELARTAPATTLLDTLRKTLRNTLIHPVVLPVVAGLLWNMLGFGLHPLVDTMLAGLGVAVVPLCLVAIGMTLAVHGVRGKLGDALRLSALKLLLLPLLVLATARWGFGLDGLALKVAVMMAALPAGTNALIFAQRYRSLEPEATAVIVISTALFALSATAWLTLLAQLA